MKSVKKIEKSVSFMAFNIKGQLLNTEAFEELSLLL